MNLFYLLQLCRLYYVVPMSLAYALTVFYARGGTMSGQWWGLPASTIALALVIASAYVFNDVADIRVDRINSPSRPLPAGRITRNAAVAWGLALLVAGLLVALTARAPFAFCLVLVSCGLLAYNRFSKQLGVFKQLAAAALMTSIYPLALAQAGGATGRRAWTLAVFPVWLFLTSFGYELLKDIRDIAGDRSAVADPSPVHRDPRLWRRVANITILAGLPLLAGPHLLGCGWVYVGLAVPAMLAAALSIRLPPRQALACIYAECVIVGLAATADVLILRG